MCWKRNPYTRPTRPPTPAYFSDYNMYSGSTASPEEVACSKDGEVLCIEGDGSCNSKGICCNNTLVGNTYCHCKPGYQGDSCERADAGDWIHKELEVLEANRLAMTATVGASVLLAVIVTVVLVLCCVLLVFRRNKKRRNGGGSKPPAADLENGTETLEMKLLDEQKSDEAARRSADEVNAMLATAQPVVDTSPTNGLSSSNPAAAQVMGPGLSWRQTVDKGAASGASVDLSRSTPADINKLDMNSNGGSEANELTNGRGAINSDSTTNDLSNVSRDVIGGKR